MESFFLRGNPGAPVTTAAPGEVLKEWQRRRALFPETGKWPLILGPEMPMQLATDDGLSPSQVLSKAKALSIDEVLYERLQELVEDGGDERLAGSEYDFDPEILQDRPDWSPHSALVQGLDSKSAELVYMTEVPCANGWQIPAYHPFGGWNECPADEVHCAVFEKWNRLYGAEVIGMSDDVIELYVPKPIHDPQVAKQIAQEMFAYSSDIVEQGTDTVEALAQAITGSHLWFFWWD